MRLVAAAAFLSVLIPTGFSQKKVATPAKAEQVTLLAEREIKEAGTLKLRGHVQVVTPSTTIYADEVDYNPLAAEVDARGHVRIDLKKATPTITVQNSTPEDLRVE
jgi:lipopolysaccharide assembly outer membrane protein LptD (OstA)